MIWWLVRSLHPWSFSQYPWLSISTAAFTHHNFAADAVQPAPCSSLTIYTVLSFAYDDNDNNNKAFKSQTSWGRLELKSSRSNQGSCSWIAVFQALLSKAKSLGILHPFKSPFIASIQVNFGLPLPLFTLLSWLRIPLRTGASGGLRCTCPNHLDQVYLLSR